MIDELRITGLGVIAEATLDLHPGFTVVTGETGAGKTMVVTGLGLLLGQRADPGAVRTGTQRARVEGRVRVGARLDERLDELGAAAEDHELVVARQVSAQGRSRCWLGGAGVPVATCAEIMGELVTIHGQSEQLRLASADHQRELLDRAAGPEAAELGQRYRTLWQQRRTVAAELAELVTSARERAREADMLGHALDEIAQVDPQPGEDAELATEATRLQDVDDLRASAHAALAALAGDDDDPGSGGLAAVAIAERAVVDLAGRDTLAEPMVDAVRQVRILLDDLTSEIAGYLDRVEADPQRLETITARRAALSGLTRKYGETIDEVLAWAGDNALRLADLTGTDDRIAHLESVRDDLDTQLGEVAAQLSAVRRTAAATLADDVAAELAVLAMPKSRLEFVVTPDELGPHGADRIELQFAANPGSPPRPIGKVASGGELSRVRLALEVVLADQETRPEDVRRTYVFDEVDSGVGGAVAVEIGRRLAALARHSQVIVVTHLAQVAAFADRHLVVAKADDGQITTSGIGKVDEADRAAELARMMAGLTATDASLAHARELLDEAGRSADPDSDSAGQDTGTI